MHPSETDDRLKLTRRSFVQGLAALGLVSLVEGNFNQASAEITAQSPPVLTGNHFDLAIEPIILISLGDRRTRSKSMGRCPGPR
jgi:hypothetical protein